MSRAELLEQHGRAYGDLRLAVAFTAGLEGDDAKRVTARGWDRTPRLADPEQAAAIVRTRGERRNPAVVLRPSALVGVDVDGREGVELLRLLVPEGMPRTVAAQGARTAVRRPSMSAVRVAARPSPCQATRRGPRTSTSGGRSRLRRRGRASRSTLT